MKSAVLRRRLRFGLSFVLFATAAAASGPKAVVAPHEGHEDHGGGEGDPLLATHSALGATACRDGFAGLYPCRGVDLQSFVPLGELSPRPDDRARGIWGWTDPQTRREYAIVPLAEGTSFVDVTDAGRPRVVGYLPGATTRAPNREVNVYADHALVVADGAGDHGIQVFDLTQLRRLRGPRALLRPTGVYQASRPGPHDHRQPGHRLRLRQRLRPPRRGLHMLDVRRPRTPRLRGLLTPTRPTPTSTTPSASSTAVRTRASPAASSASAQRSGGGAPWSSSTSPTRARPSCSRRRPIRASATPTRAGSPRTTATCCWTTRSTSSCAATTPAPTCGTSPT